MGESRFGCCGHLHCFGEGAGFDCEIGVEGGGEQEGFVDVDVRVAEGGQDEAFSGLENAGVCGAEVGRRKRRRRRRSGGGGGDGCDVRAGEGDVPEGGGVAVREADRGDEGYGGGLGWGGGDGGVG